jgi:hypothetical protein
MNRARLRVIGALAVVAASVVAWAGIATAVWLVL